MRPYEACDFLNIDEQLSDEEKMIRDTIRQFTSKEIMPIIAKHYEEGTFPKNLIPMLAELGTLGATIEGYGCAGLNPTAYGLIMQELERGDSGIRSFVSVQGALCMYPIYAFGTEEHKKKYLPHLPRRCLNFQSIWKKLATVWHTLSLQSYLDLVHDKFQIAPMRFYDQEPTWP